MRRSVRLRKAARSCLPTTSEVRFADMDSDGWLAVGHAEAEIDVFEAWFGDLFDELFGDY